MQKTVSRRAVLSAASAAVLSPMISRPAWAQNFPSRPITLIVPWPAGGATDRHLRTLADIASAHLGQRIVVDNRPGGGGTNGPGAMAMQARPDGYTIAQFPLSMLRIPHMHQTAWHPINDFSFIIGVSGYTFGFVVRGDSPLRSFQDYVEAARREPGKIDYGSTGTGTSPHLLMEALSVAAGIQLNHIPFRGNADLMQAVLGGHVRAGSDATGWDQFVDNGQMRLLLTFGEQRTARWPQVPTAKDLGFNLVAQSPYGLAGPSGMDPAVVQVLHDAFKKAMDDPRHLDVLRQLNQDIWYRNGADYRAWAMETFERDRQLIQRLGLAIR